MLGVGGNVGGGVQGAVCDYSVYSDGCVGMVWEMMEGGKEGE